LTQNVEELHISGSLGHNITTAWTERNRITNSQGFPKLRKLTVGPLYPMRMSDIPKIEDFVARTNRYLGVCAKLEYVLQKRRLAFFYSLHEAFLQRPDVVLTQDDVWFWEVPVGMAFW
jgi:hypothetical protein